MSNKKTETTTLEEVFGKDGEEDVDEGATAKIPTLEDVFQWAASADQFVVLRKDCEKVEMLGVFATESEVDEYLTRRVTVEKETLKGIGVFLVSARKVNVDVTVMKP